MRHPMERSTRPTSTPSTRPMATATLTGSVDASAQIYLLLIAVVSV
jgi:hypothetical protein